MTANNYYCLTVALTLAFFAGDVAAQVSGTSFAAPPVQRPLPPCPGSTILSWTACMGTYTLPDGTKYVSEWKDGKPIGQGTMTFLMGPIKLTKRPKCRTPGSFKERSAGGELKEHKVNSGFELC